MSVPEDADLTVAVGCLNRSFNSFLNGKVLVITSQYLCCSFLFMREAGEVLYNVKEALFREDSFKECVVIDLLLAFIVSILGLPFHEAVFAAGDCTSLRTQHVAHHTEGIVCEH